MTTTLLTNARAIDAAVRDLFVATLDAEGLALRAARDAASVAYLDALAAYHRTRSAADRATLDALKPAHRATASDYSQHLLATRAQRAERAIATRGRLDAMTRRTIRAINTMAL